MILHAEDEDNDAVNDGFNKND